MKTTAEMLFMVTVVWALFGSSLVNGITVSPDVGFRNTTSTHIFETILINKTLTGNESVADRNRRLIPYMTFYMPNDFSAGQHYNFVPEQQHKQIAAPYQSHQPQRIRIEHQQQPHHFQIRYPTQRPKYQAILYGTRHQISSQGNNHLKALPLSFKDSNSVKTRPAHHQHSTPKVNLTPFIPSNKLPGQFTPIIYVHPTDNVNYSRKPQSNTNTNILQQYNEVTDEQQNYQGEPERIQPPAAVYTTPSPKLPMLVSPSPRPLYPLLNEVRQNQHNQPQHTILIQQQSERSSNLTPQQKYVEYLKEQLRYKQQQYYSQQPEPAFIINASPSPPLGNNGISYKPDQEPGNQIIYQPPSAHSNSEEVEESYNPSPSPQPMEYNNYAPSPQSYDYNHSPSPRPPTHNAKYVDVIVDEPQQIVNIPSDNQVKYKQNNYISTPSPMIVSSVPPMYEYVHPEPFRTHEISKTMQPPMPIEMSEQAEQMRPVYSPQLKYKTERKPAYLPTPTLTPQTIHQHLTETTQVPPPILTTYHPNFVSLEPKYNSHTSSPRPYKSKIVQKFKPIILTKQEPQTRPKLPAPMPIENLTNMTHNSLADILHKLQESNQLPKTFTPDNIDNSIRTLIKILNNLKQSQTIVENPPQHHEEDYDDYADVPLVDPSHPSPNSGRPGIDYPALAEIPPTSFNCKEQRYKGFFGDPETNCQVWHYCDLNGGQASFLCPNGTIFSQVALTCDWWFNVKCSSTAQLYVLNERLYKYILPLTPKFPEDYSGPLVDKYLALKFKEMEEKMRREKTKGQNKLEDKDEEDEDDEEDNRDEDVRSTTHHVEKTENYTKSGGDNTQNVIVTTTPLIPSLQSMPIVVTSTEETFASQSTSAKTSVESEKLEVIEIKTDGTSGHITPPRIFNSGLKK